MANRKSRRKQHPLQRKSTDEGTPSSLPDAAQQQREVVEEQTIQQLTSGPIPDPETLARYNEVIPGTGDTIVEQWRSETEHRRQIEREVVDAQTEDARNARAERRRGQIFALIVALAGFGTAAGFAWAGHPTSGAVIASGTLASMVIAFLGNRRTSDAPEGPD